MMTDDGLLARLAAKLRQHVCGLHGHDSLLHFDNGRISLMCASCGHESPGWDVGRRAARQQPEAAQNLVPHVVRVAYADERRVA
jgi:hypothetical protein